MAGAVRRVGLAVEPPGSAHLRPAWPPANPPTRTELSLQAPNATVTFNYNYVTVRCPYVYVKLSTAISMVLDSRDSLGCPPPPREGAEDASADHPSLPSPARAHAQVPDLTVDCNVRARRAGGGG